MSNGKESKWKSNKERTQEIKDWKKAAEKSSNQPDRSRAKAEVE